MIEKLQPYDSYSPDRHRWLGQLPSHWRFNRLGHVGVFFKGNGGTKSDEVASGIPCVRYGDLYSSHKFFIAKSRSFISQPTAPRYTRIEHGDLLFAGSGETLEEIGKSAVNLLRGEVRCGGDVLVFRPSRPFVARFLGYAADCFPAAAQKSRMGRGQTIMHVYARQLKYLWLPVPPPDEQAAIVKFLDHANGRIQRHIQAKVKLIKLLEEQKQVIIHRAVTRGTTPNVRVKPSELKWVGDVPEHWDVRPAKYFVREVNERSETGTEELLSVSHLVGVKPRSTRNITMFKAESYVGHKLCRPGDLVINTMWAWMGALGVSRRTGIVSPSYHVYRQLPGSMFTSDYGELLVRSWAYVAEYRMRSTGIRSSRLRFYPNQFLHLNLLCPPIEEQEAIVEQVKGATIDLNHAIAQAREEIELMREYRTRLTADVVTGQLDVREAASKLPDAIVEQEADADIDGEDDDFDEDEGMET